MSEKFERKLNVLYDLFYVLLHAKMAKRIQSGESINIKLSTFSGDRHGLLRTLSHLMSSYPPICHPKRIRNIAPNDLEEPITVTVSNGENTGTVTYSPLTYCYLAQSSSDTKLQNTVKALYLYWVEADKYFV